MFMPGFMIVVLVALLAYLGGVALLIRRFAKTRGKAARLLCAVALAVLFTPVVWDFGKFLSFKKRADAMIADIQDGFEEETLAEYLDANTDRFDISEWQLEPRWNEYYVVFRNSKSWTALFTMHRHAYIEMDATHRRVVRIGWTAL